MKLRPRSKTFFSAVITLLLAAGLFLSLPVSQASAQEITAIDFNGDLLGKVIPDGKVVGFNNQLIGNVTADSLIVNFDGKLIGGVVPQGIAIGNDAKPLGKVSNDGSVRLASGQIVGKVLPNGLVVNDYFDIVGAVLFPGLVYSDDGKTVGRVTGEGLYTSLAGQQIGIVTPDGYAYRRVGSDFVLDGRLISSKMVVSLAGEFIGSVVPGGGVSDFEANTIGRIRANGFAYNEQGQVIGRIVKSGYAFDNNGFYLGFVTYNGEVVDSDKLVGRLRADGTVMDAENRIIGYSMDIAAAATDFRGKYIGRIMPEGNFARAKETTAVVGARGVIFSTDGTALGQISARGPVFDYKGSLAGHALPNGSVIALNGTPIGYMVFTTAYDLSGRIIGSVLKERLALNSQNQPVGLSGISAELISGNSKSYLSPYGFVFNQDGQLSGGSLPLGPLYNPAGNVLGQLSFDGTLQASSGIALGSVLNGGFAIDPQNRFLGKMLNAFLPVSTNGRLLGNFSQQNLIMNNALSVIAKVLPDNFIVSTDKASSPDYMPLAGNAYGQQLALNFKGDLLGYTDLLGNVNDLGGTKIGSVLQRGLVTDNNNLVIGALEDYSPVMNDSCEIIGVLTPRGDIRNFRGVYLGKILPGGLAVSDSASIIGHAVKMLPVIDFSGSVIGFSGIDGKLRNYAGEQLGCLNREGQVRNADHQILGRVAEAAPVIGFGLDIIGRTTLNGTVVDKNNLIIGYQQPDENVNSTAGLPLGALFRYKVAFNLDNKFMGRVLDDGTVVDDKLNNVGRVNFEGFVISQNRRSGYALNDFYVYDKNNSPIGYIARSGDVVSFANQNLGSINRGFLVDKDQNVLARGSRDYNIRDKSQIVLGRLLFNGDVIDSRGNVVGTLGKAGEILNRNNEVIAQASPLQYYSKVGTQHKRQMVFDKDGNFIGYLDENGNIVDRFGNIIGRIDENGNIIGADGKPAGEILNNRPVYDQEGDVIGLADSEGSVRDANGKIIAQIDEDGNARDASGNIIGGINSNWYEKAPSRPISQTTPDDSALKLLEGKQYRKSLGAALTPDGEYLGEIMEDGSVVDKDDNVVGRRMPDGLIIDDDGTLVGIEEIKKPDTSGMFVPPGTFGNGGAYGTGTGPAGNLGPGGGFGPGERYDPARQAALNAAMSERRKNISVGKISNGTRKEAFDGMQKDWTEQGIPKVISSWRVDLSEMIFADKPIPAVIARAIDSNNPAPITAFVERNVYAEEGRNVIIPAGSRLMGTLGGVTASQEATSESARVQISWERLIRPDGSLFVFQGLTADAQGRAGALGYVDQQLFKKYTLPVLTTSLTSATSYYMAPKEDSKYDNETPRQQAANDARQNFLNEMNQVFDEILADKSNIKPMTYIPAGTRIIVFPNTDLWLRTIERDQDESAMLQKPQIFIDDGKAAAEKKSKENENIRKQAGTPVTSDVVYEAEDAGVEKATPLLSTPKKAKKNTNTPNNPAYIAPPPPPSSSGASGSSGSSTSGTNNGVPALF